MIRRAEGRDAAILSRIHALAFPPGWTEDAFMGLLKHPGVLAFLDEKASGFILLRAVRDEAEILTFAVAPDARRGGLGRALLRRARGEAALLGTAVLFLEVAADNIPALNLYAAEGFEEAGRRRGYYPRAAGPDMDAVILRLTLTSAA